MAGNLKLIKRRIKSASNIGQITKAMEMVAASKMKKSQKKALASKPYSDKIYEIVVSLMKNSKSLNHPLLQIPESDNNPLIIFITTNRGLCGSLNINLFRFLNKFLVKLDKKNFEFVTLGKKGLNYSIKHDFNVLADYSDYANFSHAVGPITSTINKKFINQESTSVYLLYNDFINALKQEPKFIKILPISDLKISNQDKKIEEKVDYLIEPSKQEIINFLLPFYLETLVREAVLEAEASEYSARMLAMKNATESANELVGGLTLEYNKARQQEVTTEIADIVTAKISMEA